MLIVYVRAEMPHLLRLLAGSVPVQNSAPSRPKSLMAEKDIVIAGRPHKVAELHSHSADADQGPHYNHRQLTLNEFLSVRE